MTEREESEIEAMSSKFEAVKIAMTQDKNGHVLKLSIHPNDTPEDIMRDLVGTRYMVVVVRVTDDGQPTPAPTTRDGLLAVKIAASLCRDERFQLWLLGEQHIDQPSEEAAAVFIRTYCKVKSRSELKTNGAGRERLLALRDEFADHLRRGIAPRTIRR